MELVTECPVESSDSTGNPLTPILDTFPPLPPFIEKDTWGPREAVQMTTGLHRYWSSPVAALAFAFATFQVGQWSDDTMAASEERCAILREEWTPDRVQTILADQSFAQMMLAAALTAPAAPLHIDEVVAPQGAVFFREEMNFSGLVPSCKNVRAIIWTTFAINGTDESYITILVGTALSEADKKNWLAKPTAEHYARLHPYLLFTAIEGNTLGRELIDPTRQTAGLLGLVRSISAIARSQSASSVDQLPFRQKKKAKQLRNKRPDQAVRVISLRSPEHGRYELDAATGRKQRQHWVRGHWRQQWYPRAEEHRTIWIDGFVKGDADLGTVTGPKVYVAQG